MRQIKFRAWDKQRRHMFDVEQLAYNLRGELVSIYGFGRDFSNDQEALMGEEPDLDKAVLMQFTGLHDKNGRDIYEGDLLRVELDDDPDSYYIAPVTWCGADYPAFDIMSKYWPKNVSYDTNVLSAIVAGWSEEVMSVVGNIYENPELMEVAEHDET
ncbi:YopX family protein [Lacticaseibacillus salsurivasis]|uniref:YopX family protein n=1 Tax=Lacticaseibacillus salsurivasis TaxID=3081441 RepID=UPI0030C71FDF